MAFLTSGLFFIQQFLQFAQYYVLSIAVNSQNISTVLYVINFHIKSKL